MRLLGQTDGRFSVLRDGQVIDVPAADIFHEEVKGQRVPDIDTASAP